MRSTRSSYSNCARRPRRPHSTQGACSRHRGARATARRHATGDRIGRGLDSRAPVAEIGREIEVSIDLLTHDGNAPDRQRSVRASFEHSWRLLNAIEQQCLAQLSVFAAPFTREAAEQVAATRLPVLVALADKSLLRARRRPLLAAPSCAAMRPRLSRRRNDGAAAALRLLRAAARAPPRSRSGSALDAPRDGHRVEDMRAAWRQAVGSQMATRSKRWHRHWSAISASGVAPRKASSCSVRRSLPGRTKRRARTRRSNRRWRASSRRGDLDRGEAAVRTAIRLQRAHRRGDATQPTLYLLGANPLHAREVRRQRALFRAGAASAQAASDPAGTAKSLNGLAACARAVGDYSRALELQRQALDLHESLGNVHEQALLLNDIGVMLHTSRQYGEACEALHRALALTATHRSTEHASTACSRWA